MSSRPPQIPNPGLYRQDDERRRDEARVNSMQNQIDELRQAMREVLSRQLRGEDQLKSYEGAVAQNRLTLEQIRQESAQTAQARALDENRTRQQLLELETRLEDAIRPIRTVQAHVNELLEESRKKVDDTGIHQKRYDELAAAIESLAAQTDRTNVVTYQVRDTLDGTRTEIDQLRRDIIRAEDAAKIIDQDARRRIADVAQVSDGFSGRIDELRADLAHVYDLLDETRRGLVHIDPTFEELRAVNVVIRQEHQRFQTQIVERVDQVVDRIEDIRQDADVQYADVRSTIDQRAERLTERIDQTNELVRDLGFRVGSLNAELDALRQVDAQVRRDLWYLHEQRVRLRLEQVQQELDIVTHQRRDAESISGEGRTAGGDASPSRPRRRILPNPGVRPEPDDRPLPLPADSVDDADEASDTVIDVAANDNTRD